MSEEESIMVTPDDFPGEETAAAPADEVVATDEPKQPKKKKATKHKATHKKPVHHKKIAVEPVEEVLPIDPDEQAPLATADSHEEATETDGKIAATLESIYRDRAQDGSDMGLLEIKKTGLIGRFFGWLVLVGVVACALGLFAWWYLAPNIKTLGDNVSITLKTPDTIELGATTTLEIVYANNESVPIRNTILQMYYPLGFVVEEASLTATNGGKSEWLIGTVPANEKRSLFITGYLYAPLESEGTLRALLSYRPDGFESTFQKNAHVPVLVTKSPFDFKLSYPETGTRAAAQKYSLTISQLSKMTGTKLAVRLVAPSTFTVSSSTVPYKNGVFALGQSLFSTSTKTATIDFNGTWSDTVDEVGVIAAELLLTPPNTTDSFSVASAHATTTLVKNEATLSLAVNGNTKLETVQPGDVLATTVQIANNGKTTLKNGTLKLIFEAPAAGKVSAYDWANLTDNKNGTVTGEALPANMRRGTIVWTSKQIAALATLKPGGTILTDISLPIKDAQSFDWATLAGGGIFSVKSVADFTEETGKDVRVESTVITMKLRTNVALEVRDVVNPNNVLEHNTTWVVTNNLHPLKNLELTATLFGDATFQGPSTTPAGTITYDAKTKTIKWVIPEMPVGVDVLAIPFTITLNKTNETQTQLASKVRFKATDTVSGDVIELLGADIPL